MGYNMKYLLLYKLDEMLKENLLNGYLKDGFNILYEKDNVILIKKSDINIIDEDIYVKVLFSFLNRSKVMLKNKSFVSDLTDAFIYVSKKEGFSKFDNKFEWYIRNIITKEIVNNK